MGGMGSLGARRRTLAFSQCCAPLGRRIFPLLALLPRWSAVLAELVGPSMDLKALATILRYILQVSEVEPDELGTLCENLLGPIGRRHS
jgi:hypothetical protein